MPYYVASQPLPLVGDKSYKVGELVPQDAPGLQTMLSVGLVSEFPGEPPKDLIPEATPAAKKAARKKKIDPEEVEGSGKSGRVTKEDVEEAAEKKD